MWSTSNKSPMINILCCVGSSWINKIKSSMEEPRGPGIGYIITNKKSPFLFPVQLAIPPEHYVLQLLQRCSLYWRCNKEPSHVVYSYWCLSNHPSCHQYVLQDYNLYWFLWNRIGWNKLSMFCLLRKCSKWQFHDLLLNWHILIPFNSIKGCCQENNDSFLIRTISFKADSFSWISLGSKFNNKTLSLLLAWGKV